MRLQRGATFPFRGVQGRLSSRWPQRQRASHPPPWPSSQRQIAGQIRRVLTRASAARWLADTPERQAGKGPRHAQTVSRELRSKTGKVGCGSKPNVRSWYLKVHAWWRAVQVAGFGEKSDYTQKPCSRGSVWSMSANAVNDTWRMGEKGGTPSVSCETISSCFLVSGWFKMSSARLVKSWGWLRPQLTAKRRG